MNLFYISLVSFILVSNFYEVICEIKYSVASDKTSEPHRIAIIGSGIGGAATAHFLNQLTGGSALLDVYESGRVGGRLATASIAGEHYEMGGSVIHPDNFYMKQFVKELGLSPAVNCPSPMGLFDGSEFVYRDSVWQTVTVARILWRYGWGAYKLHAASVEMLTRFSQIYPLQRRGLAYKSPASLLHAMHPLFPAMVGHSTRDHLLAMGISTRIIDELVMAATLCNYGQTPDIHAFVGSIGVAGASPRLWSVAGGNKQVPELLIAKARASLLHRRVTEVAVTNDTHTVFKVTSVDPSTGVPGLYTEGAGRAEEEDSNPRTQEYDAVIIATPLTTDKSDIKLVNTTKDLHFPGRYERIVATLVQGTLRKKSFKLSEGDKVDEILIVNPDLFYNAVSVVVPVDIETCSQDITKQRVYKVFSGKPLKDEQLRLLFNEVNSTEVVDWLAYPHYESSQLDMGEFELQAGLYHVSAVEWAGSAMEMSAVAARNVALMALKYLTGDPSAGDQQIKRDEL